jgi:hypothetical protein
MDKFFLTLLAFTLGLFCFSAEAQSEESSATIEEILTPTNKSLANSLEGYFSTFQRSCIRKHRNDYDLIHACLEKALIERELYTASLYLIYAKREEVLEAKSSDSRGSNIANKLADQIQIAKLEKEYWEAENYFVLSEALDCHIKPPSYCKLYLGSYNEYLPFHFEYQTQRSKLLADLGQDVEMRDIVRDATRSRFKIADAFLKNNESKDAAGIE